MVFYKLLSIEKEMVVAYSTALSQQLVDVLRKNTECCSNKGLCIDRESNLRNMSQAYRFGQLAPCEGRICSICSIFRLAPRDTEGLRRVGSYSGVDDESFLEYDIGRKKCSCGTVEACTGRRVLAPPILDFCARYR